MIAKHLVLLALLAASAAPGAALAQDFTACDGYDTPKSKGDGMTTAPLLWGLASGNADIRSGHVAPGAAGVVACDTALKDPKLLPAYLLRRAHLLQAKALHQIASGAPADALATLEQSDATGAALDGPYFRDSLGLGNRAVRAFALIALDRKAEAVKEIEAIEAMRPYAPSVTALTEMLRLKLDNSLAAQMALLKKRAVRDPAPLLNYFLVAIEAGKLEEVAAIGGSLSFDLPRSKGGWSVEGDSDLQYELISGRADIMGGYAYALAATGKGERAAAVIAEARRQLTEAMTPPPPPAPGYKWSKSVTADYSRRSTEGGAGNVALDGWEKAIALRPKLVTMNPEDALAALRTLPRGMPVVADLLAQVPTRTPQDAEAKKGALAKIYGAIETRRLARLHLDLTDLQALLPRPETAAMQPRFKHAGDGYFLSDNGFSRRKLDDAGNWTVRFTHDLASRATVEELAMLSAATLAKKEGYDALLIQSRRTLTRTMHVTTTMYYVAVRSRDVPSGNEALLNVLLVKGGALPDSYRDAGWRLLNADTVIADLAPKYQQPAAR